MSWSWILNGWLLYLWMSLLYTYQQCYPKQKPNACKLLVFGHRSLTKNITQTAVIDILKTCILNLKFRMLVNIHFQKDNRYNFWKGIILYCTNVQKTFTGLCTKWNGIYLRQRQIENHPYTHANLSLLPYLFYSFITIRWRRSQKASVEKWLHAFFYKNKLYNNTQVEICPKIKNRLTITRLKFWSDKFRNSFSQIEMYM